MQAASNTLLIRGGPRSKESIQRASRQLENFARVLSQQYNVKIRRPEPSPLYHPYSTPYFNISNHYGITCPRDTLLTIGNEIIESPMSLRCRYLEFLCYRNILNALMEEDPDMLWTMAPKPTMADSLYDLNFPQDESSQERKRYIQGYRYITNETEPVFDAADVLRLGKDLIVQHGNTTNRKGIDWLRRQTKSRGYRVHEIHFPDDPIPAHIDATLVPLVPPTNERKGILVNCTDRPIAKLDYDKIFKGSSWDIVKAPEPNSRIMPELCQCSCWISINLLMVRPDVCIVEDTEIPTINFLESLGIKCVRVPFRDVYEFGGSFHCTTADIRRKGERQDYFPNLSNNNGVVNGFV